MSAASRGVGTLYYAIGGGLGHVTRARRVLDTLGLRDAAIVTASLAAIDPRVHGGHRVIVVPPALEASRDAHRSWVAALLRTERVERLLVDTFPLGIRGELATLPRLLDLRVDYIGRLLRFERYLATLPDAAGAASFETAYLAEALTEEHHRFIEGRSRQMATLDLAPAVAREIRESSATTEQPPFWLLVHSGPAAEVEALVAYTLELRRLEPVAPRVIVASPCDVPLPAGFERRELPRAHALFPAAARIVSAAGFNVMLEAAPWRERHEVLPFERRFDDQHLRAARAR